MVFPASEHSYRPSDDLARVTGNLPIKVVRVTDDSVLVDDLDDRALIEHPNVIVKKQTRLFPVGDVGDESERLDGIPFFVIRYVGMVVNETDASVGMENAVVEIVFGEFPDFDVLVNLFLHPHEIVRIDEFEQGFSLLQEMLRTVSEVLRNV